MQETDEPVPHQSQQYRISMTTRITNQSIKQACSQSLDEHLNIWTLKHPKCNYHQITSPARDKKTPPVSWVNIDFAWYVDDFKLPLRLTGFSSPHRETWKGGDFSCFFLSLLVWGNVLRMHNLIRGRGKQSVEIRDDDQTMDELANDHLLPAQQKVHLCGGLQTGHQYHYSPYHMIISYCK